ncbi:hypothetical protein [Thiomicrorhabdus lithotrophica]|uniref:Uncharacterized protein n=1 Tax=Thiomicrorhabdus lithotrophica TaxID=2949997 RepID=A0ABY8CB07_9GAMM|nr:hypothetical protein [Thiomicrorhabdus lithotrophica]WEJ62002.1 hypothetical protein NR989_08245 [Thiomicrorhabdus lithotrophica]
MSKVKFSTDLFEQLGGTNWVTRPGNFFETNNSVKDLVSDPKESQQPTVLESNPQVIAESNESTLPASELQVAEITQTVDASSQMFEPDVESKLNTASHTNNAVVLIGPGLERIWQNEDDLAWQLWQNIMKAFRWDESQVVFFDTELLVTEDMIFSTMEEVIDLGVEWVLTMDEMHEVSEQLAEGVHVVSVPEFESMLSDPYSKQSFYHSVVPLKFPT